jgi:PAS domain S-box-containing protein
VRFGRSGGPGGAGAHDPFDPARDPEPGPEPPVEPGYPPGWPDDADEATTEGEPGPGSGREPLGGPMPAAWRGDGGDRHQPSTNAGSAPARFSSNGEGPGRGSGEVLRALLPRPPAGGRGVVSAGPARSGPTADSGHADECGCLFAALQRADQVAHEVESRLTVLLETLPVAILGADADGAVTSVNQTFCDLFELPELPADLLGTDCRMLVRPARGVVEDPADFAMRLELLLRRRRSVRGEEIMFSDGRVFERAHTVIHRDGEYAGHFWTYLDVTERRILEAETEGLIAE